MGKLNATIYDENDRPIKVGGFFIPGYRGSRDKYGAPLEPDVDDEIVDVEAWDEHGEEYFLEGDELGRAMDELWDQVEFEG